MFERTVPIYALAAGGLPVLEGSGVLLRIEETVLLVTAAHVMAEIVKDGRIALLGIGHNVELLSLEGLDVQVSHDRDDVDVSFIRLPGESTEAIGSQKRCVDLDEVDIARRPPETGVYIAFGFPRQLSRPPDEKRVLYSDPYYIMSTLHTDPHDFTPGTSIALTLRKTDVMVDTETRDPVRLPALQGISGGGIWRLVGESQSTPGKWDVSSIRLAGIEHGIAGSAIKGVLAFRVIDAIAQNHPDLAPAIDRARTRIFAGKDASTRSDEQP